MSNTFVEPLLTDTESKEWLFTKEHSIILNSAHVEPRRVE